MSLLSHTDPNAEIKATVDPRRGNTPQLSDAERQRQSEKRREAYLSFLADLDMASPPVVYYEDYNDAGILLAL